MKKVLAFLIIIATGLMALMPLFSASSKNEARAVEFDEGSLTEIVDILDVNGTGYADGLLSNSGTPYDYDKQEPMPGKILTPNQDEFNQFDLYQTIDGVQLKSNQSVYAWVYIPNSYLKDLSVTLYSVGGASISWTISSLDLYSTLVTSLSNISVEGWKLFEFSAQDYSAMSNITFLNSTIFTQIKVSYRSSVVPTEKNSQTLSLYHIFIGDGFSGQTRVIKSLSYYNYKFNANFLDKIKNKYLYDELKISSRSEIFDNLYAGKTDLLSESSLSQTLYIFIRNTSGTEHHYKLGQSYIFEEEGFYTITFKVTSQTEKSNAISKSFYIEKFDAGYLNSSYRIDKGEKYVVPFKLAPNFIVEEDISVIVGDKSVAKASYYVEDGVCYIVIEGVDEGKSLLTVSMVGKREGFDKTNTYTYTTDVIILDSGTSVVSMVLLWSFFGVICAGLVIFLIISFVKARKFGVK